MTMDRGKGCGGGGSGYSAVGESSDKQRLRGCE
jgi:hypothetical protein